MTSTPLHAEDLPLGVDLELGSHVVTLEEILDFARQWDPQDFHTDPEAARAGQFGEVIASGLHTLAIYQRLAVHGAVGGWAVVAGRRIADLRFHAPVVAGDRLHASMRVESVGPERRGRALVALQATVRRDETTVLTASFETFVRTRPSDDAGPQDL